jgi:hypothetical protein
MIPIFVCIMYLVEDIGLRGSVINRLNHVVFSAYAEYAYKVGRRKMTVKANYQCSDCGRHLDKGEFIAIIGNTPPTGLSAPLGRADTIFENVGKIYCEECFEKRYERKKTG